MLLLRKGIYRYEYMDNWRRFDEKPLPDESDFCSGLNIIMIYMSRVIHYY